CPQSLDEREPLSSSSGVTSVGLLVDTNLDTSTPDTYRAPPVPIPYDTDLGRPQTPPDQENCGNKVDDTIAESIESTQAAGQTNTNEGMKESPDCKSGINSLHSSPKEFEDEPSKLSKSVDLAIEEEDCPICLEGKVLLYKFLGIPFICRPLSFVLMYVITITGDKTEYDEENPRIITKCEHYFHLSCILEWMERSDTCPVCDQEMIFQHNVNM
ncbi:hypothetical protein GIB67_037270, partial [Kingdonia uniflora]